MKKRAVFQNKKTQIILKFLFIVIGLEFRLRLTEHGYYFYHLHLKHYNIDIAEDAYRIVCLGESTVEGSNAPTSFPEHLKSKLTSKYKNKKIQVFNLGVAGIGSSQISKNSKIVKKRFNPDLVILLTGHNRDFSPGLSSKFPQIFMIIGRLRVVRLLYYLPILIEVISLRNTDAPMKLISRDGLLFFTQADSSKFTERDAITQINYIKQIIQIFVKDGGKLLLCNYFESGANKFLEGIAEDLDIPFCNIEKIYRKYEKKGRAMELLDADMWHPNEKGYKLMAEKIYNRINEENLIDR